MIPHSKPTLPEGEEWLEVTSLLKPGWAADGPCVAEFGRQAAAWFGCEHGFAVNSGSNALHLALLALNVQSGDEVIVPAYCCAALLNAVRQAGATPVLADVEPRGFNICPEDTRRRLTPRTRAVVVAHMFGSPAPLQPFLDLGIPVVEDCAQSLGATDDVRPVGSRGRVSIGSFYATKVITTGQGGLLATSDSEIAARVGDLTHYDNREDWTPRFNYGLGEPAAALGLWQLGRLPGFLQRRARIAASYDESLGRIRSTPAGSIAYRYTLRTADADAAMAALRERGIDAKRPVYRPLHHYLAGDFPHAQAAHEQIVSLPIYPTLPDLDVERVSETVRALAISLI